MNASLSQVFLLVLLCLPAAVAAQPPNLQVQLTGLSDELLDNAMAWLGAPPNTAQSRANYLFAAREKLTGSLQALGYYNAEFEYTLTRDDEPWQLHIAVQPGEPVRLRTVDVRVTGAAQDDAAFTRLLAEPGLRQGDRLNHETYQGAKRQISRLGLRRGYFDARWERSEVQVEPDGNTADVLLHYHSGERFRFGATHFDQGLLQASLVQQLIAAQAGEPYDQALVQKTQADLQRTGYFSTVILQPDRERAESQQVPLKLDLYPARRHSIDLGAGFSTDTRERVSVTWRTPRINSLGHSQETRVMYSPVNPSGRVVYKIPLGHPNNDVLQLSARLEDNEYGDLDSNQEELAARREKKRGDWVYSYGVRGLSESWEVEAVKRESDYLLPGLSLSQRKRSGDPLNPSGAFSQWYRLEGGAADAGSDMDLLRLAVNLGHVRSLGERHRMVFKANIGAALVADKDRDQLAPSLNFFAGGDQSIRGYSYQSIGNEVVVQDESGREVTVVVGGDRLLTASAEYQYQWRTHWRTALFVDAGDAFDDGDFDTNVGLGFGLHYVSPVGAIRLDLANPVTDDDPSWRLHFSIGAEF